LSLPAAVGGEDGIDTYFDLFERLLTRLEKTLPTER
jgi:hypothetical protein